MRFTTALLALLWLPLTLAFAAAQPPSVIRSGDADGRLESAMNAPLTLDFVETPLSEVVDYLASALAVDVLLDTAALDDVGLSADTPVSIRIAKVRAAAAVSTMLQQLELTWMLRGGAVVITTPEAEERALMLRTYPVADLIQPVGGGDPTTYDYDSLISNITAALAPDSWDEVGGPGSIEAAFGAVVIQQTQAVHKSIERFLAAHRTVRQLFNENRQQVKTPTVGEPAAHAVLRAALSRSLSLDVRDTPLAEVIAFLQTQAKVPLLIDVTSLDDVGLAGDMPITHRARDLPLATVLNRLLEPLELTYQLRHEVIVITTPESADNHADIRLYPVYDLVAANASSPDRDPHALLEVVMSSVVVETWDEVGGACAARMSTDPAALIVRQTESGHAAVQQLLEQLRQARRAELALNPDAATPGDAMMLQMYQLQGATPDEVVRLLARLIGPAWTEGDGILVETLGPTLILRHRPEIHRQTAKYLNQLGVSLHGGGFGGGPTVGGGAVGAPGGGGLFQK